LLTALNVMVIFFIHLSHSKEHKLLRSMVGLQKKLKGLALLKERSRIAKDLHDGAGANMASIAMQCDYLLRAQEDEDVKKELILMKECATESIADMRRSIAFLYGDFDITEQIEQISEKLSTHSIVVEKFQLELLSSLSETRQ